MVCLPRCKKRCCRSAAKPARDHTDPNWDGYDQYDDLDTSITPRTTNGSGSSGRGSGSTMDTNGIQRSNTMVRSGSGGRLMAPSPSFVRSASRSVRGGRASHHDDDAP